MKTVTARQMKEIDRRAIHDFGIPAILLMENAGLGVARVAKKMLGSCRGKLVAIFCGKGSNGGDGFVAARHLINWGSVLRVYLMGRKEEVKGDPSINLGILEKMKVEVKEIVRADLLEGVKGELDGAWLIIDALLGTGLKGGVEEPYRSAITFLNQTQKPILSIDTPSGLDATSGKAMGVSIKAARTATMALPKQGFYRGEGPIYVGEVEVVDIGIPRELLR